MKFEKTANIVNLAGLQKDQMMDNGRYKKKTSVQQQNLYQYKTNAEYEAALNQ